MPSAKHNQQPSPKAPVEIVDPVWLIRALAISLAAALLCAWLTACLLFYQGAWQLVLQPSHTLDRTPANVGFTFTSVRFGDFNTGQPHLNGWWIPASTASTSGASPLTVLYLHGGSGSLSDTLPVLSSLHSAGLNVFAIDYRGFGASDSSQHPDADRMAEDAATALDYLVATLHITATSIVPTGSGLGAALAVQLASEHHELPAVILDNPDPDPATTAAAARPSRVIPVRLLFGKRFAIAEPLEHLATPKLLIATGAPSNPALSALFGNAAKPSDIVVLPADNSNAATAALTDAMQRFLARTVPAGR